MNTKINKRVIYLPIVAFTVLLAGCDMLGPSDGEFVQACLEEGKRGVNKQFGNEMGINRETFCKCAASEARASLSPDGYRAMILDMQGKGREAREITSRMNSNEQMAMVQGAMQVFGKCSGMIR